MPDHGTEREPQPVAKTRSRADPGLPGTGGADGESSAGRHELSGSGGVTIRHPAIRVRTRSVPV